MRTGDLNSNGGRVGGHDLLHHEAAHTVHRNRSAKGFDAGIHVFDFAADGHGHTAHSDGIDGAHILEGRTFEDVRLGHRNGVGDVQRGGCRLVIATIGPIDAQQVAIALLARLFTVGGPGDALADLQRDDRHRGFARILVGAEDADLCALHIGRIVAEREETHRITGTDHRLVGDNAEHRADIKTRGLHTHICATEGHILTALAVGAQVIGIPFPVHADAERGRSTAIGGFEIVAKATAFHRSIVSDRTARTIRVAAAIDLILSVRSVLRLNSRGQGDGRAAHKQGGQQFIRRADHCTPPSFIVDAMTVSSSTTRR